MSYPGLLSHKQYALMQRLSNTDYGCGGILTLDLGSQKACPSAFCPAYQISAHLLPGLLDHHMNKCI